MAGHAGAGGQLRVDQRRPVFLAAASPQDDRLRLAEQDGLLLPDDE